MRKFFEQSFFVPLAVTALLAQPVCAQILMSARTYSQNFDSLTNSGNPNWTNNVTLPGWYASKTASPNTVTNYNLGAGSSTSGALYSFGDGGSTERALGSLASGTPGNFACGIRFVNDTDSAQTNFMISYTGEEWRIASANVQRLAFSYQVGASLADSDAANAQTWTGFSALDFNSPNTNLNSNARALEGNDPTNRVVPISAPLTGVVVQPGQEIFFRWYDADDSGSDDGLAIDDLTISFQAAAGPAVTNAPVITTQPQNEAAGEGGFAIFSAGATGSPPPDFQWQLNGTNLPGAISPTLVLNNVTTNQAGTYSVVVANSVCETNSLPATLVVMPDSLPATNGAIVVLTYNVDGNSITGTDPTNWAVAAPQVQAIGRELIYFNPDIITFNEIPSDYLWQMTNWVTAFLPGYYLATNSTGDGYIQSVIASRFPVIRSASHLQFSSLAPYGYTGTGFTRDLFEAQIAVPNWPLPLHVFVAHLKSTDSSNPQDDANKRAAMAPAVSNYFATVFLPGTNGAHPYVLAGDMNEDAFFPETDYVSGQPIQRLTSPPTGLQMTIPINPITRTDLTESVQGKLDTRFDYILPCGLLFSNIAGGEVFRTDLLAGFPPDLFSNDDKIASDHLPVLMVFNNPFDTPFKLLSIARTNHNLTLNWESQNNRNYSVETSPDLLSWTPFATNILTTTTNSPFVFTTNNAAGETEFFRVFRAP